MNILYIHSEMELLLHYVSLFYNQCMPRVAIFGAGVAGLTAAHHLSALGYDVHVYESEDRAGGLFRSDIDVDTGIPTEYSWHGFGPWYNNVFSIMKEIPFITWNDSGQESGTVYTQSLSRPIEFGILPDASSSCNYFDKPEALRMTLWDRMVVSWSLLKVWSSNQRSLNHYSSINASQSVAPYMSPTGLRTWRSTFGPWIGSDWKHVSLHHVGRFFEHNLYTDSVHSHSDSQPSWSHGAKDGWLLLKGPSNDQWFDPWVAHLQSQGVVFHWNTPLTFITRDSLRNRISGMTVQTYGHSISITANIYILAVSPFELDTILSHSSPSLLDDSQLRKIKPLIQDGPHVQVSFRLAFNEKIHWPRDRTAIILSDSEYNLTICDVSQIWETNLGQNVQSLWTCTACVSSQLGRIHNLPLEKCTKQQFIDEVLAQIYQCQSLNEMIIEFNGKSLADFTIITIEVWHEWLFSTEGISTPAPKWVNTTHTEPYMPSNPTSIPNLFLAGAHTRTDVGIWSIEAAVESGRRVCHCIDSRSPYPIPQSKWWPFKTLACMDDGCYAVGLPHVLDVVVYSLLILGVVVVIKKWRGLSSN